MSNQKGLLHQETFRTVKKNLKSVNVEANKRFGQNLKSRQGILAKIKHFIYLHPNKCYVVTLLLFSLLIILSALIIRKYIDDVLIRLVLFLLMTLFYLFITVGFEKIVPRYFMEWDERWPRVMGEYLRETSFSEEEATSRLKRAILYYQREGNFQKRFINLFWSGIFISCVSSDSIFQEALMRLSLGEMFKINPLGTISIVILPLMCTAYWNKYGLPIAWLENVVSQIEMKEVEKISNFSRLN